MFAEHLLGKPLTVVDQFHSHLEAMKFLRRDTLHDQVSFSFSNHKDEWNVVDVDGFDLNYDPNRYNFHLYIFYKDILHIVFIDPTKPASL